MANKWHAQTRKELNSLGRDIVLMKFKNTFLAFEHFLSMAIEGGTLNKPIEYKNDMATLCARHAVGVEWLTPRLPRFEFQGMSFVGIQSLIKYMLDADL